MTIRTKMIYQHTGASGGNYQVDEHYDDVLGTITSHTHTVPLGQTLQVSIADNVQNWSAGHVHNEGTSTTTPPAGKMLRTIPFANHDPRLSYSFTPSD